MAGRPKWKRPPVQSFNCSLCGGVVEIRAPGHTLTVACSSCGSLMDATDPNYKLLHVYEQKVTEKPLIPLGTRGRLKGDLYEVIGYMIRCDGSETYLWREYLLFNPTKGFRFLMLADGHWNLINVTKRAPKISPEELRLVSYLNYFHKKFDLYHKGTAKVKFVLGEFYWRVKVGDESRVIDFVNPPDLLSVDMNEEEMIWSTGTYLPSDMVKEAFKISKDMPTRIGVAPNQPSDYKPKVEMTVFTAFYFLLFLIVIQFGSAFLAQNELVYIKEYNYVPVDGKPRLNEEVSEPFKLDYGKTNVEIQLHAPVRQNWFEASFELVNEQTGDAQGFDHGVEYYFGSDWSEGSQNGSRMFATVPSGVYRLKTRPVYNRRLKPGMKYEIKVRRDVPIWANFWIAIGMIWIIPCYYMLKNHSHQVSRWSYSDYSPYTEH